MAFLPFAGSGLQLLGTTGPGGYTLVNGTGTIFSWTAPADGQFHRVILVGEQIVGTAQTGGQVTLTITDPGNTVRGRTAYAGGLAAGFQPVPAFLFTVAPGSTVTFAQTSALTAGSGILYTEMWGS